MSSQPELPIEPPVAATNTNATRHNKHLGVLALGALGVVFGDIGTSPLYAMQQCFKSGLQPVLQDVLGVTSLIFWAITIVVSLKYVMIVMRANNHGEGGILALMSLATSGARRRGVRGQAVVILGLCGAALFFGDSLITPAISVLSAVEGLEVVSPELDHLVLPVSVAILFALFFLQKGGTQRIGSYFGPIMMVWFVVLAALGLRQIIANPAILAALNPVYAIEMIAHHGTMSFVILGAALLAFTGAEALYADMGHFGIRPIRYAWMGLVMPALVINYFGQGALILSNPAATLNPFYMLAPEWLTLPLVMLSAIATVIASQAVITGTFSVVQQAIQLNYLPHLTIKHTSSYQYGQIYVPQINWILCVGVLLLVGLFRSSDALAGAYGFAVTGAMMADTLLVYIVARAVWHWSLALSIAVFGVFLSVDMMFFAASMLKIFEGGWLPLLMAVGMLTIFLTWKQGRDIIKSNRRTRGRRLAGFLETITPERPLRVPGTAVYLASLRSFMPQALVNNLHHNRVLHEHVFLVTVMTEEQPRIEANDRAELEDCSKGIYHMVLHYGFMETPNVAKDILVNISSVCDVHLNDISFFVSRDVLVEGHHHFYPRWRKLLFLWLSNNATAAHQYFRIPNDRVVEIGVQIEV